MKLSAARVLAQIKKKTVCVSQTQTSRHSCFPPVLISCGGVSDYAQQFLATRSSHCRFLTTHSFPQHRGQPYFITLFCATSCAAEALHCSCLHATCHPCVCKLPVQDEGCNLMLLKNILHGINNACPPTTCPVVCVSPVTQVAAVFAPDSLYTCKYCRPVEVKDSHASLQDRNFHLKDGRDSG